ncbi:GIY-YIG nuclease family protein [Streptomyces griseoincarnatus]
MTVPKTTTPRRAAVYRLYDAQDTLLYIGSAYDPEKRCRTHRAKPWWPEVARREDQWVASRRKAYVEEMKAIAVEGAKHNQMGTPTYQTPDTEAVRRRKELAPLRQKLLEESWTVRRAAYEAALAAGATAEEAELKGKLAEVEFLEDTGLFAAAVKERRRRLLAAAG